MRMTLNQKMAGSIARGIECEADSSGKFEARVEHPRSRTHDVWFFPVTGRSKVVLRGLTRHQAIKAAHLMMRYR